MVSPVGTLHPEETLDVAVAEMFDVDAVERSFFGPQASGVDRLVQGIVSFEYLEHVISVRNDGWIVVYNS